MNATVLHVRAWMDVYHVFAHILALIFNPCRGRERKERERKKERNQARAALRKAQRKEQRAERAAQRAVEQDMTVSTWAAIARGSGPT